MNLPTVTQVLSIFSDYTNVNPHLLKSAQERGSAFHALAACYLESGYILDIPDNVMPYFISFEHWAKKFVEEVVWVEKTLIHPVFKYQGTPDALLRLKGDEGLTLPDWKTGAGVTRLWEAQVAAYCELADRNGWQVKRAGILQPHPKGKIAKFTEYTGSLNVGLTGFLSALQCWRFFVEKK